MRVKRDGGLVDGKHFFLHKLGFLSSLLEFERYALVSFVPLS